MIEYLPYKTEIFRFIKGLKAENPDHPDQLSEDKLRLFGLYFLMCASASRNGFLSMEWVTKLLNVKDVSIETEIKLNMMDLDKAKLLVSRKKNHIPTLEECEKFFVENDCPYLTLEQKQGEGRKFFWHKQSRGWKGIEDWRAAARLWRESDTLGLRARAKKRRTRV
jgi:hypothetical protein